MSCICRYGPHDTVSYTGRTAAFHSKPDGSELVLCKYCEGVISKTPTARERLYSEGRLGWQSWTDRKPQSVRLPEIDFNFASAIADALPDDIPIMDGDIGRFLPTEASATVACGDGLG